MNVQSLKLIWAVLAGLIAAISLILIACLTIDPKTEYQAAAIERTVPIMLDLLKIIVGAVVGVLGTTLGMRTPPSGAT